MYKRQVLGDSSSYQEETSCSLFAVYNRPLTRAYVAANLGTPGETIPATPAPEAALSSSSLAFPDAGAPGIPSTATLTISNNRNEELGYSLALAGDPVFSALTEPAPIAPGGSQEVELEFAPTSRESFSGTLIIDSNDWSTPTFELGLSGTGMEPQPGIQVSSAGGGIGLPPVFVPGGQLFLGDAHAAMGHGELSASGLEMSAVTEISVELKKAQPLAWPRIEDENEIMTVTSGAPTERTIARAYAELILWMEADFGWNRWKAYDLLTHVGEISVGYYDGGSIAALSLIHI